MATRAEILARQKEEFDEAVKRRLKNNKISPSDKALLAKLANAKTKLEFDRLVAEFNEHNPNNRLSHPVYQGDVEEASKTDGKQLEQAAESDPKSSMAGASGVLDSLGLVAGAGTLAGGILFKKKDIIEKDREYKKSLDLLENEENLDNYLLRFKEQYKETFVGKDPSELEVGKAILNRERDNHSKAKLMAYQSLEDKSHSKNWFTRSSALRRLNRYKKNELRNYKNPQDNPTLKYLNEKSRLAILKIEKHLRKNKGTLSVKDKTILQDNSRRLFLGDYWLGQYNLHGNSNLDGWREQLEKKRTNYSAQRKELIKQNNQFRQKMSNGFRQLRSRLGPVARRLGSRGLIGAGRGLTKIGNGVNGLMSKLGGMPGKMGGFIKNTLNKLASKLGGQVTKAILKQILMMIWPYVIIAIIVGGGLILVALMLFSGGNGGGNTLQNSPIGPSKPVLSCSKPLTGNETVYQIEPLLNTNFKFSLSGTFENSQEATNIASNVYNTICVLASDVAVSSYFSGGTIVISEINSSSSCSFDTSLTGNTVNFYNLDSSKCASILTPDSVDSSHKELYTLVSGIFFHNSSITNAQLDNFYTQVSGGTPFPNTACALSPVNPNKPSDSSYYTNLKLCFAQNLGLFIVANGVLDTLPISLTTISAPTSSKTSVKVN